MTALPEPGHDGPPAHVPMSVGGRRRESSSRATFPVHDPATGGLLATVADASEQDVRAALDAAEAAREPWAATTAAERAGILRRAAELMTRRVDALATTMTREQGKPLAESRAEMGYATSFLPWFAGEAERAYGRTVPASQPDRHILVVRRPVGIAAAITPWNFPAAMVTRKVAPALAAGCPVLLKPSEMTPLTALELAGIFHEAGLPAGVLSVLPCSRPEVFGDVVLEDPRVRKLTFTGSTRVGKELLRRSAGTVKNVSLELGGHAPFIVFDDADIPAALDGLMIAKIRNGGQTCLAANRIYVHESITEEFTERLTRRMADLTIGNGLEEGVDVGPLIDDRAMEKVRRHVSDAVAKGATLAVGGHTPGGTFFEPTVLRDVRDDMLVAREETFGPVAAVLSFSSEDEVVRRANASVYGLAAYCYTRDLGRMFRLADSLEYGIIGVNDGYISVPQAPFGGLKESGLGREGGSEGIDGFLETKYLAIRS